MMTSTKTIYSVHELNELIKQRLESDARFANCYVSGEISNFKHHSSGHMYFTLKDEKSRIRAVMFASRNRSMTFRPEDGMRVVCLGAIGVFDRDGQYQLYVDEMQPDGIGALYVAFEQLCKRLASEGLFAVERKRKLPTYPLRIGVVTSPTGAVIRDICSTLERRYPLAKVILAPALVQGPEAATTIVAGLERLVRLKPSVDVIIVGRGGGSLEELWPFNEEILARAIAACPIPVVSAVGHETDFTICDYVADVRAATPTAAAELVAPHIQDMQYQIQQLFERASASVGWKLNEGKQRLAALSQSPVILRPEKLVDQKRQMVDYLEGQLRQHVTRPVNQASKALTRLTDRLYLVDLQKRMTTARMKLDKLEQVGKAQLLKKRHEGERALERFIAALEALNPLQVLKRGYSIVYGQNGTSVIQSTTQVASGDKVYIHLSDGRVSAIIDKEGEQHRVGKQLRLDL